MAVSSTEYVLDDAGWDEATRLAATHDALVLVAPAAVTAETDIPWHRRDSWPPEVAQAARRLRDRFVPENQRARDFMQTGVKCLPDDEARDDFVTFSPYAYDATLWADGQLLASLADEGASLVVSLTDEQRDVLERALGVGRVVTLQEWRERHPSALRRHLPPFRSR